MEEITIKFNNLSLINSQTAKNGYKEENLVCSNLNNNKELRDFLYINKMLSKPFDYCSKIKGNHKIDISSQNKILKAQIKKYKESAFQQLDRHKVNDLINYIPELNNIKDMLKKLCEIPLQKNKTHVNKKKGRVLLSTENYSNKELDQFINLLNKYTRKILEYAFYGNENEDKPDYLIGVEYIKGINKRNKLVFFKISDIIDNLEKEKFKIKKSKSVISLGDNYITLQRKGGDGGKKSSNDLAFKIIISKLNNIKHLEYKL